MRWRSAMKSGPSIGMSPSIRAAGSTSTPDDRWRDGWATTRTSSPECLRPPLRADVVISNGVINLCADKRRVFNEVMRVLRPGGRLQFADIATGKVVPEAAVQNIDLWTD